VAYSELAIRNNAAVLEYCKTAMSALSGVTAGLLGLTGTIGFAFYFIAAVTLWLMVLFRTGSSWRNYFSSREALLTNGIFSGLFTYILFWTFIYGMVHVY